MYFRPRLSVSRNPVEQEVASTAVCIEQWAAVPAGVNNSELVDVEREPIS